MLIGVTLSGSILYFYCYFGQNATDYHLKMADCVFESNWYLQPVIFQKYFITIIQNAQQPIYYHGFGVAKLNLNTYCRVRLHICVAIDLLTPNFGF